MGCGGNNTAAVVEEIRNTDWSGIDGILSVCPYYNKPSQEGSTSTSKLLPTQVLCPWFSIMFLAERVSI